MKKKAGHVYLVGAGPGPADLLTVRARSLLRKAQVLAYDDLVHPSMLELVSPLCELLPIGYRAGTQHDRPPPLHPEVLARAQAGALVVRLKSGDPMIFGRGGEEAAALASADIPYTIVPGITAALAAAASCRLPLTWRGLSAELRITTQSTRAKPQQLGPNCTWALYMPRHAVRAFTEQLLLEGCSRHMPAAFIIAAALPEERCIESRLGELADAVETHTSELPGLVLIGESLRGSPHLSQAEKVQLPLRGSRVLIARASAGPSRLGVLLKKLGADAWEGPWIQSLPLSCEPEELLLALEEAQWIAVPSASAWRGFLKQLATYGLDLRALAGRRLIAFAEVQEVFRKQFIKPDFAISHQRQLLNEWPAMCRGRGMVLAASDEGESIIARLETLRVPARLHSTARLVLQYPRLSQPAPDFIIIPHRKALRLLFDDADYCQQLKKIPVIALGEQLAADARALGCSEVMAAPIQNLDEAAAFIIDLWETRASESERQAELDGRAEGSPHTLYGTGQR